MQFRKFNEMGPKLLEGIAGATKKFAKIRPIY